jgi:hypothetical protein
LGAVFGIAAAPLIAAQPAFAATVSFETDDTGYISVGSKKGKQTDGKALGPFTAFGTTFSIDADTFDYSKTSGLSLNNETDIEITQNNEGLGIDNNNETFCFFRCSRDDANVDGKDNNDIFVFSFDDTITLSSVIFENVGSNDDFLFYMPGADNPSQQFDISGTSGDEGSYSFDNLSLKTFGIGAYGRNDDFRISGLEGEAIAPVPLPATLPLLAAGLAGLGWAARRKARRAA